MIAPISRRRDPRGDPGGGPGGDRSAERRFAGLAPTRALRRLEFTIVRRLEGFLHGEHLGLLPGPGTELAEARVYRPGEDDVRRMDWAVTARTTTPHVRDVIADRELETWALVDLSPSMDFGTAAMDKRELAVSAAATIGFLTNRMGDRFGGYIAGPAGLRRWPARSGRLALYAFLRSLLSEPRSVRASGRPAAPRADGFVEAVEKFSRNHPRRGLRVVISDFLDDVDAGNPESSPRWERAMKRLSGRHQVLAVEIIDPIELELPDVGVVWLTDPETGAVHEVNTARARVRHDYAAAATSHRLRVRRALRRAGAAHLTLRTDRDWVSDIARFVLTHRHLAQRLHGAMPRARAVGGSG